MSERSTIHFRNDDGTPSHFWEQLGDFYDRLRDFGVPEREASEETARRYRARRDRDEREGA